MQSNSNVNVLVYVSINFKTNILLNLCFRDPSFDFSAYGCLRNNRRKKLKIGITYFVLSDKNIRRLYRLNLLKQLKFSKRSISLP